MSLELYEFERDVLGPVLKPTGKLCTDHGYILHVELSRPQPEWPDDKMTITWIPDNLKDRYHGDSQG